MNGFADAKSPFVSSAALRAACSGLPAPRLRPVLESIPNPKQAAILIPVVETPAGLAVIVTRRHSDMRLHSDHWVFPGGRVDPADRSSADAAIRETSEELGVPGPALEMLGQLDSRGPIVTGYLIDVFVALLSDSARLNPRSEEVAEVATLLLSDMCRPENAFRRHMVPEDDPSPTVIERPHWWDQPVLHFAIRPDATLWGLQADILAELLQHLDADHCAHLMAAAP